MSLAKVWPLMTGVPGLNAAGGAIVLQPGQPGWMHLQAALDAQDAGMVQLMAGQTPQSLKKPRYDTKVVSADEQVTADEEDDFLDISGAPKPRPARKKYNRRDVTAEK